MYTQDFACISIGDQITEPFSINQGVKQGCILSPLLFNIFISDLSKSLDEGNSSPIYVDEVKTLNSVIWADDLLILSETENGLNNMLKNLEKYAKDNFIEVNLEKTKCMIFNKTSYILRPGKSSSTDGIPNEMILCLLKTSPRNILKLFNTILDLGKPIATWNIPNP